MFGFGRRKVIEDRAKSLGDLMYLLVECLHSMSFEELIEANHHLGNFIDEYIETDRSTKDRHYGFYESKFKGDLEKVDFDFIVTYSNTGAHSLSAEGHLNYFGIYLFGFSDRRSICIDKNTAIPASKYGRDMQALETALLKVPRFYSGEEADRLWKG